MPKLLVPAVARIRLAIILRELREGRNLTIDSAADELTFSASNLSRYEAAKITPNEAYVREMLDLYQVPLSSAHLIEEIGRQARPSDWWHGRYQHGGVVPKWFGPYLSLEPGATHIRLYYSKYVPGLFQTEDYARATLSGIESERVVAQRLRLRFQRQEIVLRSEDPIQIHAVLDESAVLRRLGNNEVMRDQYRYLVELSQRQNIEIQIVPLSVGRYYGALETTFVSLGFGDLIPDHVYVEGHADASIYIEPERVARHREIFREAAMLALTSEETAVRLDGLAQQ